MSLTPNDYDRGYNQAHEDMADTFNRVTKLQAFLEAYDAWCAAEEAFEGMPDGTPYEKLKPLARAEAAAQMELIKRRDDLRK